MRSDHKETGASKKKFKYKRLGPIHVMGKYNLACFKGAALRDKMFFQAQVFWPVLIQSWDLNCRDSLWC